MNVAELRAALANYPDDTPVITDMHSEYASVKRVNVIRVFENGGYYSEVYAGIDKVKEIDAVCISSLS